MLPETEIKKVAINLYSIELIGLHHQTQMRHLRNRLPNGNSLKRSNHKT